MKKYLVQYMAKEDDFREVMAEAASSTPQQQEEFNREWEGWMKSKDGVVDMGAALGKTKRVTPEGVSDTRNQVGGYSIVEAESHEEAARKMQDSPHFKMMPRGWIDVMEVVPM
jgi:hypothetical protein